MKRCGNCCSGCDRHRTSRNLINQNKRPRDFAAVSTAPSAKKPRDNSTVPSLPKQHAKHPPIAGKDAEYQCPICGYGLREVTEDSMWGPHVAYRCTRCNERVTRGVAEKQKISKTSIEDLAAAGELDEVSKIFCFLFIFF